MKRMVEIPGTVVKGMRLLRPAAEVKTVPQVQQACVSDRQPDFSALNRMQEKIDGAPKVPAYRSRSACTASSPDFGLSRLSRRKG
jgi:hypothetical protein